MKGQLRFDGKEPEDCVDQWSFDGLVDLAVTRCKEFAGKTLAMILGFSGGKDSIASKKICQMAGLDIPMVYNITTVDPPELTRYIKRYHPDVIRKKPEKSMFQWIVEKGFPLRQARWCCEKLKENHSIGHCVITGCRWAESPRRRKQRKIFENWIVKGQQKQLLNPIVDWPDEFVWRFIRENDLPYCELYDEGMTRIGCVGCPIGAHRAAELDRWPNIKKAYLRSFHQLWERRKSEGAKSIERWTDADDMFDWWIHGEENKVVEGQMCMQFD